MKTIVLIVLACLLTLLNGRVVLIESTCDAAECQFILMHQIKSFDRRVDCKPDNSGNRFVSTITHRRPSLRIGGIYCRAFTVTNQEREIFDFTRSVDSSTIYLHVALVMSDVQNPERCRELPTDQRYFNRECHMQVIYYSTTMDLPVNIFYFTLTVRIPRMQRFELLTIAREIIPYGCDCILDATLTFQIKIYRGEECRNEISPGASLTFGGYLCFGIFGGNEISRSSVYEIGSLYAVYRTVGWSTETINMIGLATIKCSLGNLCVRGQIYIIVPTLYVGNVDFSGIVVLSDLKPMQTSQDEDPKPKGREFSMGEFKVIEPFGYKVKLYRGASCREEIALGNIVIYRENICIGVFGDDDITTSSYFDVTALEATYTSDSFTITITNMVDIGIVKRSLDETNVRGQVYAIIPITHVGRLEIKMAIALTGRLNSEFDIEKDLLPNEILIELPGSLEVIQPLLSKDDRVGLNIVSLITFLWLLVAIF